MKSPDIAFLVYYEDIDIIRDEVDQEHQFAVLYALRTLAETGEEPTRDQLGKDGYMAYRLIRHKIIADKEKAAAKRAKLSENGKKSHTNGSKDDQLIPIDTNCNQLQQNENENENENENVHENENERESVRVIVSRYLLKQDGDTEKKLTEYLRQYGYAAVCTGLDAASAANKTKTPMPITFWSGFIGGRATAANASTSGTDYLRRNYTPDDYKTMEIDLDADDENTVIELLKKHNLWYEDDEYSDKESSTYKAFLPYLKINPTLTEAQKIDLYRALTTVMIDNNGELITNPDGTRQFTYGEKDGQNTPDRFSDKHGIIDRFGLLHY